MLVKISFLVLLCLFQLNYIKADYDHEQALDFFNYCRISYCSLDDIKLFNDFGPVGEKLKNNVKDLSIIVDEPNHLLAYAFYNTKDLHIYVVIRGTQGNINWMNNLDYKLTEYPECQGCKVHKGFLKYHIILSEQLKEPLLKLEEKYKTKKLFITGHSLGGALATLAAVELAKYNEIDKIITFGSPRVGNKIFALWWTKNKQIKEKFRVVQHSDLIAHIPMNFMGFYHVGDEVWYHNNDSNEYTICHTQEDSTCSNSKRFLRPYDHGKYMGINWMEDPYFGKCIGYTQPSAFDEFLFSHFIKTDSENMSYE